MIGIGFGTVNSISDSPVGGGVITIFCDRPTAHALAFRRTLAIPSCKRINGQMRQTGRFAISCN